MADRYDPQTLDAGIAAAPLIADPKSWINRRVETVELLSREETRRRVSVDFTLSDKQLAALSTPDGVVVPISVLAKERLRGFDLRDEGGAAVPILGRAQNGELCLTALVAAASAALGPDVSTDELVRIAAELRRIVFEPAHIAELLRADFAQQATEEGTNHAVVDRDATCRAILDTVWGNAVLFAVISADERNRRILKYTYGDDVGLRAPAARRPRRAADELVYRLRYPDRHWFVVDCPGAGRAQSFHAEIVIPEELRFDFAMLCEPGSHRPLSAPEPGGVRAALYASEPIDPRQDAVAALEIAPEGPGRLHQASLTAVLVAGLLWLGAAAGLDTDRPDAAVSLLLGGAAAYSGLSAVLGEHRLVGTIFSATRRWLLVVTVAALCASASIAVGVHGLHPALMWWIAAAACTVAAARLTWSSIRART